MASRKCASSTACESFTLVRSAESSHARVGATRRLPLLSPLRGIMSRNALGPSVTMAFPTAASTSAAVPCGAAEGAASRASWSPAKPTRSAVTRGVDCLAARKKAPRAGMVLAAEVKKRYSSRDARDPSTEALNSSLAVSSATQASLATTDTRAAAAVGAKPGASARDANEATACARMAAAAATSTISRRAVTADKRLIQLTASFSAGAPAAVVGVGLEASRCVATPFSACADMLGAMLVSTSKACKAKRALPWAVPEEHAAKRRETMGSTWACKKRGAASRRNGMRCRARVVAVASLVPLTSLLKVLAHASPTRAMRELDTAFLPRWACTSESTCWWAARRILARRSLKCRRRKSSDWRATGAAHVAAEASR
mmetsp:Transcript_34811/g.69157  ORF Transcript_34811/g.69157 Transcript_34811/m.69157 type:complete len:373 (-) Transcript_34811:455-1573(-)